jgi:hypothetical protein
VISDAEIQRYHDYAELKIRRNIGSEEEQHLASMIVNLVRVIDHLCEVVTKGKKVGGVRITDA